MDVKYVVYDKPDDGKVMEQRIIQNKGNILQIKKADMMFTRSNLWLWKVIFMIKFFFKIIVKKDDLWYKIR